MEETIDGIRRFILENVNEYLAGLSDDETPMNAIDAKNIASGAVDLSRYDAKVVCAIIPESEIDNDDDIGVYNTRATFTIAFICKGYPQDVLVRQVCRYSAAFRRAALDDISLAGAVERSEIGERRFFTDAGTVEKQAVAVEIGLTVTTEEAVDEYEQEA